MPAGSLHVASPHPRDKPPLTVWRLVDGKAGHEKQTLGLARAILKIHPGECFTLRVPSRLTSLMNWITGRFPAGAALPAPDLILGAGHATHFSMLAARRARGGKAVLLMKPSLPLCLFDLCLIPEHDRPPDHKKVIPTRGVLNPLVDLHAHDPTCGLILVGGQSDHYLWDSEAICRQIILLTDEHPGMNWTLTTSRRTPTNFLRGMEGISAVECMPFEQTPHGWIEEKMARASEVWSSPDSVSMVYEALTAGCQVGVFDLESNPGSRVAAGIRKLELDGCLLSFRKMRERSEIPPSRSPINEAARCAELMINAWFK